MSKPWAIPEKKNQTGEGWGGGHLFLKKSLGDF